MYTFFSSGQLCRKQSRGKWSPNPCRGQNNAQKSTLSYFKILRFFREALHNTEVCSVIVFNFSGTCSYIGVSDFCKYMNVFCNVLNADCAKSWCPSHNEIVKVTTGSRVLLPYPVYLREEKYSNDTTDLPKIRQKFPGFYILILECYGS